MKPDVIESLDIWDIIRCNKSMERRPASGQKEKLSQGCNRNKDQPCDRNNPAHHGSHHTYRSDEGLKIKRASPFFIFKITHFVNYEKCCNLPLPDQYYTGHYQHWPVLAQNQERAKSEFWQEIKIVRKKNISSAITGLG